MKKFKNVVVALVLTAMVMLPSAVSYGDTVRFVNFSFTGYTGTEVWNKVIYSPKVDDEQNWYLTLVSSSGLHSEDVRAIAMSYYNHEEGPYRINRGYVALKSTSGAFGATPYNIPVYKNSTYALWVSGNENNREDYYMVISGRYTS